VQFSSVCLDVEFAINLALADAGANFASKHTVMCFHSQSTSKQEDTKPSLEIEKNNN